MSLVFIVSSLWFCMHLHMCMYSCSWLYNTYIHTYIQMRVGLSNWQRYLHGMWPNVYFSRYFLLWSTHFFQRCGRAWISLVRNPQQLIWRHHMNYSTYKLTLVRRYIHNRLFCNYWRITVQLSMWNVWLIIQIAFS